MLWQALLDKLENPAGSTTAKNNARPASSKPAGKAAAKTTRQPEASPSDMSLSADLNVAARLSLSEVTFSTDLCSSHDTMPSDAARTCKSFVPVIVIKCPQCIQRMSTTPPVRLLDLTPLHCLLYHTH